MTLLDCITDALCSENFPTIVCFCDYLYNIQEPGPSEEVGSKSENEEGQNPKSINLNSEKTGLERI